MPSPLGTRPAFQHKVSMLRHGLPMQGEVEELRASVEQPVYTRAIVRGRSEAPLSRYVPYSTQRFLSHYVIAR